MDVNPWSYSSKTEVELEVRFQRNLQGIICNVAMGLLDRAWASVFCESEAINASQFIGNGIDLCTISYLGQK